MPAKKNKLKVPEDVSVVGYDNISISSDFNPPLTTVNQQKYQMGKKSFDLFLRKMEQSDKTKNLQITLKSSLVIRKSCKRILKTDRVKISKKSGKKGKTKNA